MQLVDNGEQNKRQVKIAHVAQVSVVLAVSCVWFLLIAVLIYVRMPLELSDSLSAAYHQLSLVGGASQDLLALVSYDLPWPLSAALVVAAAVGFLRSPIAGWWGGPYSAKRLIMSSLWAFVGIAVGSLWPQITMGVSVGNVIGYDQARTWGNLFDVHFGVSLVVFLAAVVFTFLWAKPRTRPETNTDGSRR